MSYYFWKLNNAVTNLIVGPKKRPKFKKTCVSDKSDKQQESLFIIVEWIKIFESAINKY